ncbi:MAG: hypothetical protein IJM33_08065 [Bacteroidales bacterium]|nr:hypothetical protein [Bacteroidales bacterium]MBR3413396.1 hypothetical protein [Bacteroidales bacterium]
MRKVFLCAIVFLIQFQEGMTQTFSDSLMDSRVRQHFDGLKSWAFDIAIDQYICPEKRTNEGPRWHVDVGSNAVDIHGEELALRIAPDSLWLVEDGYGNFTVGPKVYDTSLYSEDIYSIIKANRLWGVDLYAGYMLRMNAWNAASAKVLHDTVVDGMTCRVLEEVLQISWLYNKKTDSYDIPIYDTVWAYVDTSSLWVVRVEKRNNVFPFSKLIFRFTNIRVGGVVMDDERFDFSNPRYAGYQFYAFPERYPSSVIELVGDNESLNDTVLGYPLVNPSGDTLYLRDTTGWKLIYFWRYGCRPCAQFFQFMQKERVQKGATTLGKAGVSVFCINNTTGNTPLFQEYVEEFGLKECAYAAHDMNCLKIEVYPTYYFYAPNGELVSSGQKLDVSKLLKDKRRYERRHKLK